MEKVKYQVFVSSTFRDLADERQVVVKSILQLEHIPSGMEIFPAADTEQLTYVKRIIDECDYYILIIGGRYGTVDQHGVSFTEREYDYALASRKVILAFIHNDVMSISIGKSDTDPVLARKLQNFRDKVSKGRIVNYWTTRENLELNVLKSLHAATRDCPRAGWIRGGAIASEDALKQIKALRAENDSLRRRVSNLELRMKPTSMVEVGPEEEILLRCEYVNFAHDPPVRELNTITLTWHEIMKAIGSAFTKPALLEMMELSLAKYVVDHRDDVPSQPTFDDADLEFVKTQLIAMGYLRPVSALGSDNAVIEFLELTSAGGARLIELLSDKAEDKIPRWQA